MNTQRAHIAKHTVASIERVGGRTAPDGVAPALSETTNRGPGATLGIVENYCAVRSLTS